MVLEVWVSGGTDYIYLFIYLFNRSATDSQVFKLISSSLNSEFPFSQTGSSVKMLKNPVGPTVI